MNTAKKFAERLEEKVVCTKSDKIFEHVENDDFFHVVDAFLGGFAAYAYYVNREKECVIVGEYGAFVDWMKKHKYPMRKPEWFKENEACDYSILEPDVDFEYF